MRKRFLTEYHLITALGRILIEIPLFSSIIVMTVIILTPFCFSLFPSLLPF